MQWTIWGGLARYVARNPQLLEQQFVCGNQIKFRPIEIAAAYGREFILSLLFTVAEAHEIDIEKDLASALTTDLCFGRNGETA